MQITGHITPDNLMTLEAYSKWRKAHKAEVIAHVLALHHVDPARAIMIGDREHDIIGARKNGLRNIGVLYGFGDAAELEAAGADQLCASPADILACLARFS